MFTDEEFITKLVELSAKGPDGLAEMRVVLKGQMPRLIALAARGLKAKAVKETATARKVSLPDDFPDNLCKDAAISYWERHRRPDLVARVDEIAEQFAAHHLKCNTRFARWDMAWKTWYMTTLQRDRPPRGTSLAEAPVLFEQCPIPTWVLRLEIHAGMLGTPESPGRKGTWSAKWGPPPDQSGNRIPSEARTLFEEKHAPQRRLPV